MIRINLLAVERERTKKKSTLLTGQKVTIACSLVLVLALVTMGWRYLSLNSESKQLDADIANSQQEATRLHAIILQVQEFEQRKAQLQQRVVLIEQLRKSQTGPVHMLDQISRSLPPALWLTALRQDETAITIDGRCTSLTALSDFVANLEATGYFKKSVEILSSQLETPTTTATAGDVVKFSVKGVFITPGDAAAAAKVAVKPAAVKN
jgi:type IV pilus assembly protein PilN